MYDCAIIGAGWAGINAAREARSRKLKVCLIENNLLGGTCLNRGCIPTKALVQSAKTLENTRKAGNFGIMTAPPTLDFRSVQQRKEKLVGNLRRGIESRLSGIDIIRGTARIEGAGKIRVDSTLIDAASIIICAGSEPRELKGFEFDGKKLLSSDDALAFDAVPLSLLIIGGGSIGCEFASAFSSFGCAVTIAETCDRLLPGTDRDIGRKLEAAFRKRGITVITGADTAALDLSAFEKVLVCVGRKARIEGLEQAGVGVDKGAIIVNEYLQTTVPGIYAAGDCTGKLMLAHYASFQGRIAARNIAARGIPLQPARCAAVPSLIFTMPEIACIGLSEEQAMRAGITVKEYQFDFLGSGMAHVMGETAGMIKILADNATGALVGAFVIGPHGCELGGTLTLALQSGMDATKLAAILFAHPSLTESISEMLQ